MNDDKTIAINYFTIKKISKLEKDNYYRVTLENNYILTEDIDIILAFSKVPQINDKVFISMEAV